MARTIVALAAVPLLGLAACGGGGGDGADDLPTPLDAGTDSGAGDAGGATLEGATLTTDPGTAYAEVDGERVDYESSGSIAFTCEITEDRIVVNFQTSDGQDLLVQAGPVDGEWRGQLAFTSADDTSVRYSESLGPDSGTLGIGDDVLSYEGPVTRIEGTDVQGAEDLDAEVAVNCTTGSASGGAGGDPTAEIGGQTYAFPMSGAQSVTCEVAADEVEVRINRLSVDDLQLEIDMTGGPGEWLGSVSAYTPDGTYRATLDGAAEGFDIDGDTVTYEGPLELDGAESQASVSVTCP